MSDDSKQVEVLYFDGCPNHPPAVALAQEVADDLGIEAEVRGIRLAGQDDAQRFRFLGSPSIRVDGVDVEPAARTCEDFGFSCRMYDGEGLPPREMVAAALRGEEYILAAKTTIDAAQEACDCCTPDSVREGAASGGGTAERAGRLVAGGSVLAAGGAATAASAISRPRPAISRPCWTKRSPVKMCQSQKARIVMAIMVKSTEKRGITSARLSTYILALCRFAES